MSANRKQVMVAIGIGSSALLFLLLLNEILNPKSDIRYSITDFGVAGNDNPESVILTDLNDKGRIVGLRSVPFDHNGIALRAFVWDATHGFVDLHWNSMPKGINNHGEIVGIALDENDEARPFHWSSKTGARMMSEEIGSGAEVAWLNHINDRGEMVGAFERKPPAGGIAKQDYFYWSETAGTIRLSSLGFKDLTVRGLNHKGQVLCNSASGTSIYRAAIWSVTTGLTDLGTLGGKFVHAYLINDEGVVIGNSASGTGETRWFEWTEGAGMKDIGPAVSFELRGLNSKGVAVGGKDPRMELPEWIRAYLEIKERYLGGKARQGRAILWEKGELHDLNDFIDPSLGYLLIDSFMINDLGQIVCLAEKKGEERAVLLTPIEESGEE